MDKRDTNNVSLNVYDDLEDIEIADEKTLDNKKGTDIKKKPTSIKNSEKKNNKKKSKVLRYVGRTFAVIGLTLVMLVVFLYSVMFMLVHGPSNTAAEKFVMSVRETSAIGFLANWFYSDQEIKDITDRNSIKDTTDVTDTSLVEIPSSSTDGGTVVDNSEPIEVYDLKGSTYTGKVMIIKDPKRVLVGTVPTFGNTNGLVVSKIAERYGAVAGINGGEFVDGTDTYTAQPVGLVMKDGKLLNGNEGTTYHVTGITFDNVLVVGNMNYAKAKELNIRDCVSIANRIGPFLIVNGEAQDVDGTAGGYNPRTAIGQRADGAFIFVVCDGRQVNTVGASFSDLIEIMSEYGAVNASTMDGGTSTQMYYNGEVINVPYSPTGPRSCPTAFLVGGIS